MTTAQRIRKIKASIALQRRTLENLEAVQLADNGSTIALTKQIITSLEASLRLLGGDVAPLVPRFRSNWTANMTEFLLQLKGSLGEAKFEAWISQHIGAIVESWGDRSKLDRVEYVIKCVPMRSEFGRQLIDEVYAR